MPGRMRGAGSACRRRLCQARMGCRSGCGSGRSTCLRNGGEVVACLCGVDWSEDPLQRRMVRLRRSGSTFGHYVPPEGLVMRRKVIETLAFPLSRRIIQMQIGVLRMRIEFLASAGGSTPKGQSGL